MNSSGLRNRYLQSLAALAAMLLGTQPLEAQVGLTSGTAQVTLIARIPPHGAIQAVSPERETRRVGAIRELSVRVRLSANIGYQLRVHRSGGASPRTWVRTAHGDFQELTAVGPVTVARDRHCAGQCEREVQYRIEIPEGVDVAEALPVRYEIAISPTM